MPLVRMTTSVGCADLPSAPGAVVELSPRRARQVVDAGWGVIVRDAPAEIPEDRARRIETTDEAGSARRAGRRRKAAV